MSTIQREDGGGGSENFRTLQTEKIIQMLDKGEGGQKSLNFSKNNKRTFPKQTKLLKNRNL